MIAGLRNEQGFTLLEILATAIIVAVSLISLYMGILYADKQLQRNYHDRVATLHASGEIEWQMYYRKNYKEFEEFSNKVVLIDRLAENRLLNGTMSMKVTESQENPFGSGIPYKVLEIRVSWLEPGDRETRTVVVREDFY